MLSNILKKAFSAFVLCAVMASTAGYAEARSANRPTSFPDSVDANHGALAATAATEATDNIREQILVAYVGIRQSDAAGKSIANVIYTKAFQGPYNNQQPWTKPNTKARYYSAADTLKPLYVAYTKGGDFLPDGLKHYKAAKHFDSRKHTDFGGYIGQEGNTCFYDGVQRKQQPANLCTAGAKHYKTLMASNKKPKTRQFAHATTKKTEVASKKSHGKTLVVRNDTKTPKSVSSARDVAVASR